MRRHSPGWWTSRYPDSLRPDLHLPVEPIAIATAEVIEHVDALEAALRELIAEQRKEAAS